MPKVTDRQAEAYFYTRFLKKTQKRAGQKMGVRQSSVSRLLSRLFANFPELGDKNKPYRKLYEYRPDLDDSQIKQIF